MTERGTGRFTWPVRRRVPGPEGTAEDIAVQDIAEREAADRRLPPPEPEPILNPPPRFNLAAFRLAALGLALVLALALAITKVFVGGPPSVAQLRAEAGVDGWSVLTVGVKDDQPGVAYYDKDTKIWSGFDVDIAYMVAEDLGFRRSEVQFYGIESEDRARMQATNANGGRVPVKMVIASYSITADRENMAGVTFSAPYLYTEQSVLTLTGHSPVASFQDLKGKPVCTLSASTSQTALKAADVPWTSRNKVSQCVADLRAHKVDAISTDAAILAGFKYRFPDEFDHWDLGYDKTEAWGVNVGENEALEKLVDLTLYRSLKDPKDTRWEQAFQNNFQVETAKNGTTPIAVAAQPDVPKPDVRDLPWEDVFP
ncbi:transporter substrate-binding domain-containing protein [Actinoplanes sp. CA-030573]|uniref:transporter substrate-binding domain-containing protein n=1 Tax=Actinoplanes sp. CA-030573 TaxID=3239898 RepID=UPI003D93C128